jgi:predicted nucleic acid-binding protein
VIVVDTNVVAYAYIEGGKTELARKVARKDPVWRLPEIWRHEFLNILSVYVRKDGLTTPEALKIWHAASGSLTKHTRSVDMSAVLQLAVSARLSACDAQFAALAYALGITLVTEDKGLRTAFPSAAISMREFVAAR